MDVTGSSSRGESNAGANALQIRLGAMPQPRPNSCTPEWLATLAVIDSQQMLTTSGHGQLHYHEYKNGSSIETRVTIDVFSSGAERRPVSFAILDALTVNGMVHCLIVSKVRDVNETLLSRFTSSFPTRGSMVHPLFQTHILSFPAHTRSTSLTAPTPIAVGDDIPGYAALSVRIDAATRKNDVVALLGVTGILYSGSEFEDQKDAATENRTPAEEQFPAFYSWCQTASQLIMEINFPRAMNPSLLELSVTNTHLKIGINEDQLASRLDGEFAQLVGQINNHFAAPREFHAPINHTDPPWSLSPDGKRLCLVFEKVQVPSGENDAYDGLRWPSLWAEDDGVDESMDADFVRDAVSQLSASDMAGNDGSILEPNIQDEMDTIDEAGDAMHFALIASTGERILTAVPNPNSGVGECVSLELPHRCTENVATDSAVRLPSFVLRRQVDGLLYQPVLHAGGNNDSANNALSMDHQATFPALSFVQASKTFRRFTLHDPLSRFAIIVETTRFAYMYLRASAKQVVIDLQEPCKRAGDTSTPPGGDVFGIGLDVENDMLVFLLGGGVTLFDIKSVL